LLHLPKRRIHNPAHDALKRLPLYHGAVVQTLHQPPELLLKRRERRSGALGHQQRDGIPIRELEPGLHGRELEQRIDELLARFGLADAGDRLVRGYSGGMQRRLDIALALVHRPRVLFMDEPTTGLDPEVRASMWQEISRHARDEGLTVLLTTHYMEEADVLASRLVILDRGRIVAEGTPEELKGELRGDAVHVELGEPQANGRVHAALERVPGISEATVEGRLLHARADNGARAVPAVLQALEADGIEVAAVTVARPSLEDVYLRYAGRTFSEAEAETETEKKEDHR
jgi:ABC-2 type transport system ATP-binding protein